MPQHIRSAWFKTLGQLALILVLAAVLGLAIGYPWPVVTLAALGVVAWHYWRLRKVLLRLTARQRLEPARGNGLAVQSLGGLGGGGSLRGGHGDQRHFRSIGLARRDSCACACCGIRLDGCVEYICFTHIFCATLARISEIHDAPVRPLMGNFVPQLFDSGRKRPV